jgi:hypothetical protein
MMIERNTILMQLLKAVQVIVLTSCLGLPALAQQNCPEKDAGGQTGYKWRGDRCEGIFVQPVAGSADFRLVSFSAGLDGSVDIGSTSALKLSWAPPASGDLSLHAASLRSRHYYRMDARRTVAQGVSYNWPTDVLRAENLKPNEIGVVASTQVAGFKDEIYIPLRVGASSDYKITLLAAAELSEVYISLSRLTPDGKAVVQVIKKQEPLRRAYYPASRGISMPLPAVTVAGYYRLEAAGILKNGGGVNNSWLFYYVPAK